MLDAMWAYLLPGIGAAAPGGAAQDKLAARLAGLGLPARAAAAAPADWDAWAVSRSLSPPTPRPAASGRRSLRHRRAGCGLLAAQPLRVRQQHHPAGHRRLLDRVRTR